MSAVEPSRSRRTYWRITLCLLFAIAVPPLVFYGWFESRSRTIVSERSLDPSYRNALKHASAAAEFYAMLRAIGLSSAMAETSVVELGYLNERAELVFKRGKRDTTAEIMKDLHNNMVGIGVARWMERMNDDDRLDSWALLVDLGHAGVLKLSSRGMAPELGSSRSGAAPSDFIAASTWFEERRHGIAESVERNLAAVPKAGV